MFYVRLVGPEKAMSDFLQKCAWWLCAGVGFDLSQRLLDHFVDVATDRYSFLAWLKYLQQWAGGLSCIQPLSIQLDMRR